MSIPFRNMFTAEDSAHGARTGAGSAQIASKSEASGEDAAYRVSEILPFIPPAIVAEEGIPMEKVIQVPVAPNGSRDTPLSVIYQLCPELFAAEITPLNDSTVTLPERIKKEVPATKAAPSDNPFWSPDSPPKAESTSPAQEMSKQQPDRETPAENPNRSFSQSNPFEKAPEAHSKSAAAVPSGFSSSPAPTPSPQPVAEKSAPSSAFSAGPKKETAQIPSGFGAPVPTAESDESKPEPQKQAAPTVEKAPSSSFSGNPFESDESFETLFSQKAAEDSDIAPAGPDDEDDMAGSWGAMFESAAAEEIENQTAEEGFSTVGKMLDKKEKPAAEEESMNPPSADEGSPASEASETATPANAFQGFARLDRASDEPEEEEMPPAPTPVAEQAASAEPGPFSAKPADGSAFSGFGAAAPQPKQEERSAPEPAPQPAAAAPALPAVAPQVAPVAPPVSSDDDSDLELKAIFSTDESFTFSKLARRVVSMPGVNSCALAAPGRLVQASRSEESRIGDEAQEIVATIRNLAKLTGVPGARFFTLQTDKGTVSLFLEGECCVSINHSADVFQPGTREKLIVIARSLQKLKE